VYLIRIATAPLAPHKSLYRGCETYASHPL